MMSSPAPEIPRFNRMVYASGSIAGNVLSRSTALWLVFFFAPPEDEPDLPALAALRDADTVGVPRAVGVQGIEEDVVGGDDG